MSKMDQKMKTVKAIIVAAFAILLLSGPGILTVNAKTVKPSQVELTTKSVAFQKAMRKLWEDHVFYTRLVIISIDGDKKDLGPTVDRLLQNQVDIGNAIKPYYGEAAGQKLTSLLQDHIKTAGDLLIAAKSGDMDKMNDAKSRWYSNGDEIAAFLSKANSANWPYSATKPLMKMHLDTTMDEAAARFKGDWTADIAAFDKANEHILKMADILSLGIIRQFPNKFMVKEDIVPTEEMNEGY